MSIAVKQHRILNSPLFSQLVARYERESITWQLVRTRSSLGAYKVASH
jgi:hypothetical protein